MLKVARQVSDPSLTSIAKLDETEIEVGKVLGKGEFSVVRVISEIELRRKFTLLENEDSQEKRQYMSKNYYRSENDELRYAIKRLRPDVIRKYFQEKSDFSADTDSFLELRKGDKGDELRMSRKGAENVVMDVLATEAMILGQIVHPNIARLRAISTRDLLSPKFFIVIDRLTQILYDKIYAEWKPKVQRLTGKIGGILLQISMSKRFELYLLQEIQLTVAYDIASALSYLHKQRIIYRDLKPDNIGFDIRGNVKLFDFGLSRYLPNDEMKSIDETRSSEVFHMTGMTGTPCYMSPEVMNKEPYNEKCDVYSFGILLIELMTSMRPFKSLSIKEHLLEVVENGKRPFVPKFIPAEISMLLKNCWAKNPNNRPCFDRIKDVLGYDTNYSSLSRSQNLLQSSMLSSVH